MFQHLTVLKDEAIAGLNIRPDGIYVDCTLGGGGHSEAIVSQLDGGHLYAFDQDETAIEHCQKKLATYKEHFTIIRSNFRHLKAELKKHEIEAVDGILFDLGVSSPQLDEANRGFSYNYEAPLDMRMDTTASLTAYEIVNEWDYKDLVRIIFNYGEEKFAKQIARRIEQERNVRPIETTTQLVEIIKEAIPAPARRKGGHPAKRTFQAIRIAVNDELRAFEDALTDSIDLLNERGRICVITFHSLEDRICKKIFNEASRGRSVPRGLPVIPEEDEPPLVLITRKPITPSQQEVETNHRSRSAKLRIAEKA